MSNYTELLFMWVGCNKTGFIVDQGFNFSPSYTFTLNERRDRRIELTCKVNENYPNVWKDRNIVGLTALVGQNGTGKSTLMNCLLEPSAQERMLLVYKCGTSIHIKHNFGDVIIEHDMDPRRVEISSHLGKINAQTRISITNAMGSVSHTVDLEPDCFAFCPDTDISRYFQPVYIDEPPEPEVYRLEGLHDQMQYTDCDKLAIIGYYRHWHRSDPDRQTLLSMNSTLNISFLDKCQSLIKKMITKRNTSSDSGEIRNDLRAILKEISKRDSISMELVFMGYVTLAFEMCYVRDRWDVPPHIVYEEPEAYVFNLVKRYGMDPKFGKIAEYLRDSIGELEDLRGLMSRVDASNACTNKKRTGNVRISYADDPETYQEFCDYIWGLTKKKDSFVLRYLSIDMPQLSSGERALQNICSWLHLASTLANLGGPGGDRKTILLLLDEVDLYMHPEWQRKFLDFLSEELHNQFSACDIQIVLTTHSPLVLSDIPCGNIIYLKNEDCQCGIEESGDLGESFGASIPALLKDSFFMKETIGAFSRRKIIEVVEALEQLKDKPEEPGIRERCMVYGKRIQIIGDPIIKHKLQMRYDELMRQGSTRQDPSHAVREWLNGADSDQKREMKQKLLAMLSAIDDDGQ